MIVGRATRPFFEIHTMNYTIVGAGKSGIAAAYLAALTGNRVFLTESKPKSAFGEQTAEFDNLGIETEFDGHTLGAIARADCIITSPGVPPNTFLLREAELRGLPIISELEFGRSHLTCNPLIAITGTNGKTTTTALTAYMLSQSGRKSVVAGNIGVPLSSLVGKITNDTIIVSEASSYQLDRIQNFRPDVAVILNITPDHLAYHGTYKAYCSAKYNITRNQSEKDLLILNKDSAEAAATEALSRAKVEYFSMSPVGTGIYCNDNTLILPETQQHKEEKLMLYDELRLPGVHNCYNSMAAALAARAFEVRNENIRDSLMSFAGVEHRLEFVRSYNGVEFINDSKATNVNATWYALSSYSAPIVWIVGGRSDSNDYSALDELVRKNVRCIVAIGEEQSAIFDHFCLITRCQKTHSLEEAVRTAAQIASEGDIVLFSPACKSFDMFMNYEQRGLMFKEVANSL